MSKDIIGLSIGSKNTIVGTYKKGTFEIVVSETSARSLPTVVSYNDRERNFAELSMHTNRSNFKRTIIYPNRWLGVQKDWPLVKEESKYAYVKPVEDKNGRLGFNIDYKGKKDIYTPECLMGLFFSKLKNIWLKENINTTHVVVSVPDYYTAHERKSMVEAVEIGGLQCTALLNESSAITLAYAFQKLKEFDEDKYRTVAFVDLGHSTCNIFFSQFNKKNVKVVSVSNERFCGAREFDYLIAQKLAEDFEKKYGSNPMEAPKTKIRLIDTITKVRKSLTVNKEITISVDSLMDGEDLVYNLSRDEFEKIIEPVVKKFEDLCKNAIAKFEKDTKLKVENIHSIEMVGDTVRTPIILESIKKVMGKEVSKTLVPDECIARGCSLYAMMNSPYYTIQNFSFSDYNPYAIEMEYPYMKDGKEIIKKYTLINEGADFPASKTITFTNSQLPEKDLVPLKFHYKESPTINWLPNKLLNSFNIRLKKKKEKDWKLVIKYGLDINCIPKLEGTTMTETKIEMVPVVETPKVKEEKKPADKDKTPEDKDKKPEDKKADDKNKKPEEKKPDEKKPEEKKPEEKKPDEKKPDEKAPEDKKPEDKKPEDKKAEEKKPEEKPKMKEKKVEVESKLDVDVVETLFGTAKGILDQYIKRENNQTKEDEVYHEASRLKNSLEQYIYTTKEKFDSQLKGYYTDKERTDLTQFMDTLMTWLYSEDEKLYDKQTLLDNSKNMKQLGDSIYKRCQDWTNLRNNYNIFESAVNELSSALNGEEEKLKKKEFTYLTNEDVVKVNQLIADAIDNAHKKHELTDKAPQIQCPPVQPDEIDMLTKNLRTNVKKVYDDAEFKVKEEERKRKEAEEKKKKEEEEKKKKEEEEKKKKEEEEKKKKEEEEKKKKGEEDKRKPEDKKPDKNDPTNPDNDVNMKDATQPQPAPQNPPKGADNMDVE